MTDKRSKVNKIIRLLLGEPDDYYSNYTLDRVIELIEANQIEGENHE